MATTRPFAYNTGSTIDGTTQIGNIAIGVSDQDYSQNPGGVKWWMGPDEELGYIIAHEVPTSDQSTPVEVDASLAFWRSTELTDQSFLDLLNVVSITDGLPPFTNINDAQTWLNDNGHFTSYSNNLPTPTPTSTPLPTATPTPSPSSTPTSTPTSEPTSTPTPTSEPTSTPTPTPINHPWSYQFIDRTNVTGVFGSDLELACQGYYCLVDESCTVSGSFTVYFDNSDISTGDYGYNGSSSNTIAQLNDGYYIISSGPGLNILAEFTSNQFVRVVDCVPATGTPTPTPTPGATSTPTPTPEMATLVIEVPNGTPYILFDGETYTSNVTVGVVKNQFYEINTDNSTSNFWYWSGTGVNLPAATAPFTVVSVTGNTGTLQVNFHNQATSTPTPLPSTSTPTPTPSPNPTDTPTPSPTDTPTPTPTPTPSGPTSTPTPTPNVSTYYTIEVSQVDLDDATGSGANNNRIRVRYYDDSNTLTTTYFTVAGTFVNEICVKGGTSVELLYYKNNIPVSMINSTATDTLTACGASAPTPTPTVAPTATPTPNPTDTPTPTPTVAPTATPTPSPTDTPTPTPTVDVTSTPTPTPTSGGSGQGSWYFYSDAAGAFDAGPPVANGNVIFTINAGSTSETFNPNEIDGVSYLYFNVKDSSGTDYTSQFSQYTGGTGTITISQNEDTATYTSTTSGSFTIETIGGGSFFKIDTSLCTQTKESNNPYVLADAISISFVSLNPTPTPTPGGPTSTPTPTPTGGSGNSWYFYVPFGNSLTMPPLSNGQTVFYNQAGMGPSAVDNPNSNGTTYLMFYKNDSTGTSYQTQFSNLVATGGTINVTQNGQTATYSSNTPGVFFLDNSGFLVFNASIQTVTVTNPFNYTDPISLSFS